MMPVETYANGYYYPMNPLFASEQTANLRNLLHSNNILNKIADKLSSEIGKRLSGQSRITRSIAAVIENVSDNIISVIIGLSHLHIVGSELQHPSGFAYKRSERSTPITDL